MTGLQPDTDLIIEIATIVTDKHLTVLAEGPVLAVHQSEAVLAGHGRLEPQAARRLGLDGAGSREPHRCRRRRA